MEEFLNNSELKGFIDAINSVKELDDNMLTDELVNQMIESITGSFSSELANQAVNQIIQNLELQRQTREQAAEMIETLKDALNTIVYGDAVLTGGKRKIIDAIINNIYSLFDTVVEKYHNYSIELPMKLEEGAQVPTYAHDTDAAADMYSMEDIEIPAHFKSVPVKTGVHIQLPEGWVAMLFPRSSIGAKTPLRLSNSAGIIDSGYRGEVRALYDNIGDEPYQIHKGDRIAQMLVMPSYRFKANIVDSLEDSDRGEDGFGSTGA